HGSLVLLRGFLVLARLVEGRRAAAVARERIVENDRLEIDTGLWQQLRQRYQETAAGRRRALQLKAVDRGQQVVAILGRGLDDVRGAGKRHDAEAHVARQFFDERARR